MSDVIGCVAIINPINFSQVNRAFGFEEGNQILKEIAERIKSALRDYDIVAKLESDRYGVLLKELKNEEDALIIMTKVLDSLLKPYNIGKHRINLSFDVGLSLIPKDGDNPEILIDRAQSALTDARAKGENTFGFFRKDLAIQAFNKLKLKNSLINAIENREFIVYYQPYFDKNRKIVGAEALLRWQKDNEIIPPMEFIPYLEETEMIVKVDSQVLDIVLNNILNLKKRNINTPTISINVAPQSLIKKDFDKKLISAVSKTGVESNLINIEIIERAFLHNIDYVQELIKKLKQKGFGLSIDDFGTGYSSLSYLTRLTVDYIKIDMSFIRQMMEDVNTRSIVETIIYLSHKLNMQTIAEGVETQNQYDMLCNMGCDYFQGYLFSRPLPEKEFEKLLLNNSL
jgi:diguanylate cyclase (GGDEF)-like protein